MLSWVTLLQCIYGATNSCKVNYRPNSSYSKKDTNVYIHIHRESHLQILTSLIFLSVAVREENLHLDKRATGYKNISAGGGAMGNIPGHLWSKSMHKKYKVSSLLGAGEVALVIGVELMTQQSAANDNDRDSKIIHNKNIKSNLDHDLSAHLSGYCAAFFFPKTNCIVFAPSFWLVGRAINAAPRLKCRHLLQWVWLLRFRPFTEATGGYNFDFFLSLSLTFTWLLTFLPTPITWIQAHNWIETNKANHVESAVEETHGELSSFRRYRCRCPFASWRLTFGVGEQEVVVVKFGCSLCFACCCCCFCCLLLQIFS